MSRRQELQELQNGMTAFRSVASLPAMKNPSQCRSRFETTCSEAFCSLLTSGFRPSLPQVSGEIFEVILVMFDLQNRYIHETLKDTQVCRLGNVGVRVHRI
jgi:hypothetical protein